MTQFNQAWSKTKKTSLRAASDPVSWVPLIGASVLYTTEYDEKITNYFMQHHWVDTTRDDTLREINGVTTYVTALAIDDAQWRTKAKRIIAVTTGFAAARTTTAFLSNNIKKDDPLNVSTGALASNHSINPFAGSAMNRRNVSQLNVEPVGAYALNGLSYLSAVGSALTRVQEGGHSFGDQLFGAAVGNFTGLFFYDIFMDDDRNTVTISLSQDFTYIQMSWRY